MHYRDILTIIAVILLIPVGTYLREQTYRNIHGNTTIGRDIESLIQKVRQWRAKRRTEQELRRRYKHLNKPKK